MAALDDVQDLFGCGGDESRVLHGEEDLLSRCRFREVAGDLVGDEDGLVADLRLTEGFDALFEDADHDERECR